MDHPKCLTCKHYGFVADDWDNPLEMHTCNMVAESFVMAQWNRETAENELQPHYKGHLASVCDASAYSAELNVHQDFYCAMHSDLMPDLNPHRT